METIAEYTGEVLYVSSDHTKMINRVKKLAEEHPDEVTVLAWPENNDGCIYAKMPVTWLKIGPPRTVTMSDESKRMNSERLREYREQKKNGGQDEQ